jgi:hypothetical protein
MYLNKTSYVGILGFKNRVTSPTALSAQKLAMSLFTQPGTMNN